MEEIISFKLEKFEGPLDLLLSLIKKNKMQIEDIPISLICEQYIEYIAKAQKLDMELAVEFLVMASDLMLIKSKMLLPREENEEEEDPRAKLADALARLEAAKSVAGELGKRYAQYSGRMAKDSEDISPDKTFVKDYEASVLVPAMRRVLAEYRDTEAISTGLVRPIVARPIVPVRIKIMGIMKHFKDLESRPSLGELLDEADTRPELVAIFIGVLELIKMKRVLLVEELDEFGNPRGISTKFKANPEFGTELPDDLEIDGYNE